ncbi:hypothetical protein [uncultured Tateyamaria sp.]|uniref:hypothetical protein n=1 Tax=uncultured Tateyamaria sp. TaxID=455651 RepID=UPI0026085B75|nr:hypothetical protein [uncultured Tateyamaria sp.]
MRNLIPTAADIYNTPVARRLSITVTSGAKVELKSSALVPTGTVTFHVTFKPPLVTGHRSMVATIAGDKLKVAAK